MRRISPGGLRELAHVVDDLDPVAGVEAQHVVAAERLELELAARDHARDATADAGVLARPLERGAGAGLAGIVDFHAVELVLEPAVAAGGRQLARVVHRRDVEGAGAEHAGGRRDDRAPAGHVGVGRRAGGAGAGILGEHADLPDGLQAGGGVDTDCALDQVGLLEVGDLAIPDVEIDEVAPGGRQRRRRWADRAGRHSATGSAKLGLGRADRRTRAWPDRSDAAPWFSASRPST